MFEWLVIKGFLPQHIHPKYTVYRESPTEIVGLSVAKEIYGPALFKCSVSIVGATKAMNNFNKACIGLVIKTFNEKIEERKESK